MYSGALISGAFAGLIAAGIINGMDGAMGLRAWRWLFIIEGCITVVIAFPAIFILPNFPKTTKFLTEEERTLAMWRLEEDVGEKDEHGQGLLYGFKLAVRDIRTWILLIIVGCFVSAGSFTNFFPTVVKTLGYGNVETLLLTVPPYVLVVITSFINSWHADRTGERTFHIVIPASVGLAAFIIAVSTTNTAARYFAMMIMPAGVYTGYVICLTWISNSIPRPPAKRASAQALVNALSNATQIYASFLYQNRMGPRYVAAFIYNSVAMAVAIFFVFVLRGILKRMNKALDEGKDVEGLRSAGFSISATDINPSSVNESNGEEKGFRYLY